MAYKSEKITVLIDQELVKKIDEVKKYPRWRNNRGMVIEEALRSFFALYKKEESGDDDGQTG